VSLANDWRRRLESGEISDAKALSTKLGLCPRHTARIIPLGYLAPDLVSMILDGRQPAALKLSALTSGPFPIGWPEQRRRFSEFG
jgi:hypothetical protein